MADIVEHAFNEVCNVFGFGSLNTHPWNKAMFQFIFYSCELTFINTKDVLLIASLSAVKTRIFF